MEKGAGNLNAYNGLNTPSEKLQTPTSGEKPSRSEKIIISEPVNKLLRLAQH
jgi:hypothetical protein